MSVTLADVSFLTGQIIAQVERAVVCLLYTSDAADDLLCVDPGGRRILTKTPSAPIIPSHLFNTH